MRKPLILISNDDGVNSKGIKALVEAAKDFGDIVVVAPCSHRSGMSHAITISDPLTLTKVEMANCLAAYKCSGTPVDSVKMAINKVLDCTPDLVLSGINHGSNASISSIYSGTVAVAVEAALMNIPAISFSLLDFDPDANFEASVFYARKIIADVLKVKFPDNTCLNVNIPNVKLEEIKGIKVCTHTKGYWKEEFLERKDPFDRTYYWLYGSFISNDKQCFDNDSFVLSQNYISVVPLKTDFSNPELINHFKIIENE